MKIADIQVKSKPELDKLLAEQRAKLHKLRFDIAAGKVKNVHELKNTKKIIARILTVCQKSNS